MDEYWTDFVRGSEEDITTLNNTLLELEQSPDDTEAMDKVFRMAHTLKGNCGSMGLTRATDLAHAIEDVLDAVRTGRADLSPELMDTIFEGVDFLEEMIEEVSEHGEIQSDPTETIASLRTQVDLSRAESIQPPTDGEIDAALRRFERPDTVEKGYLVRLLVTESDDQNYGQLVVDALVDAFDHIGTNPSEETIESGNYGGRFDAVFSSAVDETAIAAALEDVDAVEAFSIEEVTDRFDVPTASPSFEGPTTDITADEAQDLSVGDLLEEFEEFDDLDALVEQVDDASEFDEMGDAGSFDDLLGESEEDGQAGTQEEAEPDDEPADSDPVPDDPESVFDELKSEVEMVGFDELQDELDELEFDEFDSDDEVGMDELLGDDVDPSDNTFLGVGSDETTAEAELSDSAASDEVEAAAAADVEDAVAADVDEPATAEDVDEAIAADVDEAMAADVDEPATADGEKSVAFEADDGFEADATDFDQTETSFSEPAETAEYAVEDSFSDADTSFDHEQAASTSSDDAFEDDGFETEETFEDDGFEAEEAFEDDGFEDETSFDGESADDFATAAEGGAFDTPSSFGSDSTTDGETAGFDDNGDEAEADLLEATDDVLVSSGEEIEISEAALAQLRGADQSADGSAGTQTVRVDAEQIDSLLTLVEGLVTTRVRLRHTIETGEDLSTIDRELDGLDDLTTELQDTVMDVRLVPLQTVTNRLPRVVRDISRDQEKEVSFERVGDDTELDRSILDRIGDPLVHLVRNAVDHGIEEPAVREDAGKSPEGSIELRAERSRDRVTITIEDDGRGLDADQLREAAVEADAITQAEAEDLSDAEAYELIFHPGLSTAAEVTDVSGRGVGMDVVKRTVEELDGTVSVESEQGNGTTITLTLPVTVAIAEVLFVEAGGEEFGVPLKVVQDIKDATGIESEDGQRVLVTEAGSRPVISLADTLETPSVGANGAGMVLDIRDEVRSVALHCDEIHGQQEVVVKPFEGFMSGIPGLSGATVRGRGEVINILDVTTL